MRVRAYEAYVPPKLNPRVKRLVRKRFPRSMALMACCGWIAASVILFSRVVSAFPNRDFLAYGFLGLCFVIFAYEQFRGALLGVRSALMSSIVINTSLMLPVVGLLYLAIFIFGDNGWIELGPFQVSPVLVPICLALYVGGNAIANLALYRCESARAD